MLKIIKINTTSRCNFSCPHCSHNVLDGNKTVKEDFPVSGFEEMLREGKKLGFRMVGFSGGEAILHPQFEKLIKIVQKKDYRFRIVSNGWLFDNYWQIIKKYKKIFDGIYFSLDGATSKTHDLIRKKPGSFKRVVRALESFEEKNIKRSIIFSLSEQNRYQVGKVITLGLKFGVESIIFNNARLRAGNLVGRRNRNELTEILNFKKNIGKAIKLLIFPPVFSPGDLLNCPFLNVSQPYVNFDGRMLFCCCIAKECSPAPSIFEIGFKRALKINFGAINEIKKHCLGDLSSEARITENFCYECNRYISGFFESINKKTVKD